MGLAAYAERFVLTYNCIEVENMAWYKDLFAAEDPAREDRYIENEESRREVGFVIEKLGLAPGMRILDLCCGRGRHLVDLMRCGYDAVGVDLSDYMLGECQKAAERDGVIPCLIRADMREPGFDSEFDAVINIFTSFGYLGSESPEKAAFRALKPGGKFLIDLNNRDWLMRVFQKSDWRENSDGDVTFCERCFDVISARLNARELTIYHDGRKAETSHSIRLYTYNELAAMLGKAGLQIEAVYGGFDSAIFDMNARRMIVIARKFA